MSREEKKGKEKTRQDKEKEKEKKRKEKKNHKEYKNGMSKITLEYYCDNILTCKQLVSFA